MKSTKIHTLKISPEYFIDVLTKKKPFELRKNDRNYQVGDILCLKEWENNKYTGDLVHVEVIYLLQDETYLQKGYVALGIKVRGDMQNTLTIRIS